MEIALLDMFLKPFLLVARATLLTLSLATSANAANISYPGVTLQHGSGQNPSLLVLVGGAYDTGISGITNGHRALVRIAESVERIKRYDSVTVLYMSWDQGDEMQVAINKHKKEYPSSKTVLVGHSWGGDTVIRSGSVQENSIDLAVTLDAVTTLPRLGHLERGSISRWVNVYGHASIWGVFGKWGSEPRASQNYRVDVGHQDTIQMYTAVDTLEILPVLVGAKPVARVKPKKSDD